MPPMPPVRFRHRTDENGDDWYLYQVEPADIVHAYTASKGGTTRKVEMAADESPVPLSDLTPGALVKIGKVSYYHEQVQAVIREMTMPAHNGEYQTGTVMTLHATGPKHAKMLASPYKKKRGGSKVKAKRMHLPVHGIDVFFLPDDTVFVMDWEPTPARPEGRASFHRVPGAGQYDKEQRTAWCEFHAHEKGWYDMNRQQPCALCDEDLDEGDSGEFRVTIDWVKQYPGMNLVPENSIVAHAVCGESYGMPLA